MSNVPVMVKIETLPALFQSADKASAHAQRWHFRLLAAQLILLIVAGCISVVQPQDLEFRRVLGVGQAIPMLCALCIGLFARSQKYDDKWFGCRAMAEAVRSEAWLWVMLPSTEDRNEYAKQIVSFTKALEQIRSRMSQRAAHRATTTSDLGEITEWMKGLQKQPQREKLATYRKERVDDQISWYGWKARANAKWEGVWRWGTAGIEVLAVAMAILQILWAWPVAFVAVLSALSAAWIAWGQSKRYSDLANSYLVAVEDLRLLRDRGNAVDSTQQKDLRRWVHDVEEAISREHGFWVSRMAP